MTPTVVTPTVVTPTVGRAASGGVRAIRRAPRTRPQWSSVPTALVAGALVLATVGACGPFGRMLGLRGEPDAGPALEVRNDDVVAVNVYLLGPSGMVFLGRVGPRQSHSIRVPGATPGDTIWLRARSIDGRPEFRRDSVVVGRGIVWRIP